MDADSRRVAKDQHVELPQFGDVLPMRVRLPAGQLIVTGGQNAHGVVSQRGEQYTVQMNINQARFYEFRCRGRR